MSLGSRRSRASISFCISSSTTSIVLSIVLAMLLNSSAMLEAGKMNDCPNNSSFEIEAKIDPLPTRLSLKNRSSACRTVSFASPLCDS